MVVILTMMFLYLAAGLRGRRQGSHRSFIICDFGIMVNHGDKKPKNTIPNEYG